MTEEQTVGERRDFLRALIEGPDFQSLEGHRYSIQQEYQSLLSRDSSEPLGSPDPYAPPPTQPKRWASTPETAIDEAKRVVHGDRRRSYGHPIDNHTRTAGLWSQFLGVQISAEEVCMLNILQKVSRHVHRPHRDNLVDIMGYAANEDMIRLLREAEEEKP